MSLENKVLQKCPSCNNEQQLNYYQSVNITLQPELRQKVLNQQLNLQICTHCNNEINIITDFLYHDMENKLMIHFKQSEGKNEEDSIDDMLNEMLEKGYIYRVVNHYADLVEKIKIFDYKLNDEIVDKIKNTLYKMLEMSLRKVLGDSDGTTVYLFFSKYNKSLFKENLSFVFFTHPSQMIQTDYKVKNLSKEDRANLFNIDMLRK